MKRLFFDFKGKTFHYVCLDFIEIDGYIVFTDIKDGKERKIRKDLLMCEEEVGQ